MHLSTSPAFGHPSFLRRGIPADTNYDTPSSIPAKPVNREGVFYKAYEQSAYLITYLLSILNPAFFKSSQ